MNDVTIRIDGLWKRYGLPVPAVMRKGINWFHAIRNTDDGPWALRDINLEVKRGETLGIIGRNGAGKSTLLKVLAGVTPPTRGRVEVRGRIFPMIELNAGVHPELTGRENVYLLGAVMGLTRTKARAKMPEIEEFCDLGDWFDRPVRKYSSGMLARLGFGVAMNVDADILMVDEVLAVGDFAFQKKCVNRMTQLNHSGVTMLFVSHNPYMIERMSDRVTLLEGGKMQTLGNPGDVIHKYFEMGMPQKLVASSREAEVAELRPGTGDLRVQRVEILNGFGQPTTEIFTGDPATIRLHYKAKESICEPNFGIRIFDPQNTMVVSFIATKARKGSELLGEGYVDCKVQKLALMPNIYTVQVRSSVNVLLDIIENAAQFVVRASPEVLVNSGNKGIVYIEPDWEYSHSLQSPNEKSRH